MNKTRHFETLSTAAIEDPVSHEIVRRLFYAAFLIIAVLVTGTIGYRLIENLNYIDSLYMTVITIATVGFREIVELSDTGKIFTMIMIFLGIGVGGFAIGNIAAFFVQGHLLDLLKGRQMVKAITGLTNHIIVCGYGKIGMEVCNQLALNNKDFIVIDRDDEKIDDALGLGYLAAVGEATDDDILLKSGIKQARGLISAISDDSANVYLVLTARALNRDLRIIARGIGDASRKKMKLAGADDVVSPFEIGARRMASLLIRPEIVDFVDSFSEAAEYGLRMEKITIPKNSKLQSKRLDESYIKRDTQGALIVGIEKKEQGMIINPQGYTVLEEGDSLLSLGNDEQLNLLKILVMGS
ncbi:NAD-binding protein [candidate division KSB1 bacterium]|nr:NAD-binding protein [candidate division KSB1 bacterium]